MKMIAVIGNSKSGKTRLIARLVLELKRRGFSVAVVKHCGHGFDLGGEDKDSSRFFAAGADGVALVSPGRWAVIREGRPEADIAGLARNEFAAADFVIVEGGRKDKSLKKIEVLRQGVSASVESLSMELAAVVADFPVSCEVPVFHPDGIQEIADWMEGGF